MRRLVISERAEADLREIWRWSYEQFVEDQADRYLDELGEGQRDAIRPGYWSKHVRKHVVFYTLNDVEVLILRVLHGSMDPLRHI